MLNTWGAFNKVVIQPQASWTETEKVDGRWQWLVAINVIEWITVAIRKNTRTTEHYQYVGMDYVTACRCAEAQIQSLMKPVRYSEWNPEIGDFETKIPPLAETCIGKVSVQNTGATMYCVDVTIDHTETLMQKAET